MDAKDATRGLILLLSLELTSTSRIPSLSLTMSTMDSGQTCSSSRYSRRRRLFQPPEHVVFSPGGRDE
ncbi:hypothetical protein AAHA92_06600 [Salvia divinorum]|uniref:Secreted protein n=1 Tax=Salvia divinorum TaxID=28513 RepID=A0ABD1I8T1_SALDI